MSLGNKTKKELYDAAKELLDENKKLKKEVATLTKQKASLKETKVDEESLELKAAGMAISSDLRSGVVYDLKFNPATGEAKVVSKKEHPSTAYASMDLQEKMIEIEGQILKGE